MAVTSRYRSAGFSDAGRRRDNNEDRFHFDSERGIYFVIDGVGGQAAGEKAADTAYHLLRARLERPTGTVVERVREAIALANNEIYELAQSNPEWGGMACVLTVAVVEEGQVTIGHVGDSRLYLIQNGEIKKLTHDHSPVGEREDRGEIDELTAMRHPRRNEVFRDVGSQEHSPEDPDFIEITTADFGPSGALLLCSDGLSDLVPASQILAIIEAHAGNPKATAHALVDAANEAGGKDNITVVIVEGSQFPTASAQSRSLGAVAKPTTLRNAQTASRSPLAFAALGVILSLLSVWLLKPHWLQTAAGTTKFGLGAVREPRTWRVSGDIGNALENALPGDTIVVAPGTYPEAIRLKTGVSLISERAREAILQTSGVAVAANDVRNARIEGFRIISDEGQPLTIGLQATDSDIEVADMDVSGAQTAGIEVGGTSAGVYRANNISGNPGTGVTIRDSAKPRFVHNVVSNNGRGTASGRPGIEVSGAAQPVLLANTVQNNAAEQIWAPQLNLESVNRQNFVIVREPARATPRPRSPGR